MTTVVAKKPPTQIGGQRLETRVNTSRMRQTISRRLKESQNTNASLTTFNEIDMSAIMDARKAVQDSFTKKHGVKLGFMSAFMKASVQALKEQPVVNAVINDNQMVYRDFIDLSTAVSTPTGLVVPVLRNCQDMGFADFELGLSSLAKKAREGKITIEDMQGGTFTITNGGVFGSMMGTPIINMP
jgi:2-oxoglutarate dehydrogenase E2 component (dihydrolipoamide succinyltransferase)